MRSKYGAYPEYHTSLDDLSIISPAGLKGAYDVLLSSINTLEYNYIYKATMLCEPQLGKRGLYPNVSDMQQSYKEVRKMTNFLAYADGKRDLIAIADKIHESAIDLLPIVDKLVQSGLLKRV